MVCSGRLGEVGLVVVWKVLSGRLGSVGCLWVWFGAVRFGRLGGVGSDRLR